MDLKVTSAVARPNCADHACVCFKLSVVTATWLQSISKVWFSFLVLVWFIGENL